MKMIKDQLMIKENFGNDERFPKGVLYDEVNKTASGKPIYRKLDENTITIGLAQDLCRYILNNKSITNPVYYFDEEDHLEFHNEVTDVTEEELKDKIEDYKDEDELENSVVLTRESELFGFGLSIDGASDNRVFPERKYHKGYNSFKLGKEPEMPKEERNDPENNGIIPFRILKDVELGHEHYRQYLLDNIRDIDMEDDVLGDLHHFFIKRFDSIDVRVIRENGDILSGNLHDALANSNTRVYSVIDLEISIELNDLVEYFSYYHDNADLRHFNGLTLFKGTPIKRRTFLNDEEYIFNSYKKVMATNRINMKTEHLGKDGEKNLLYRIYI